MGWYKTGSVNLVQGSAQVVGVGTDFVSNVNPGAIFCGPDGKIYEVDFITSATSLSLARAYTGAGVTGVAYAIAPTQSYIVDLAKQATALLSTFSSLRDDYLAGHLVGAGLELKGVLADPSLLPAGPAEGDAYLIGSSIYVWAKTRWDHSSIQGPKGDVGDVNPDNIAAAASALDSKNKAAASEANALASKNSAATSETNSLANAASASNSAGTATTKAGDAAASAAAAAASAQAAQTAASQASSGQIQADWAVTDTSSKAFIKGKPALAAVATSGNKADVGLGNVNNTSDANKPISTATQTALNGKVDTWAVGVANGIATLGSDGKVPAGQLPSYVDDVLEVATKAALPATGESGKIYLVIADESRSNTTQQYRWGGTVYTRIPTSPGSTDEVPEGAGNKYFTESRVLASILAGLSTATNAVIGAGDSVLGALGKLQAQITAAVASIATKAAKGANGDITSLTGLTTALSINQGGTAAADAAGARNNFWVPTRAGFVTGPDCSIKAEGSNLRAVTNPNSQIGYAGGMRVRFAFTNDADPGGNSAYSDVIDFSTWSDSSGGGPNALYLSKNEQKIIHKWAAPGAAAWSGAKVLAYTDSNITGSAASLAAKPVSTLVASTLPGSITSGLISALVRVEDGWPGWGGVIQHNPNAAGGGGGGALQLYTPWGAASGGNDLQFRQGDYQTTTWGGWKRVIDHTIMQYYTAGNANSVSNATGGSYTWTNRNWFRSNTGAGNSVNGMGAAANFGIFADDGGPCAFSFLRSNQYAVNIGLDNDNILRIGGWSAMANVLQLDMGGNLTLAGNIGGFSDERLKENWREIDPGFIERWANVKHGIYDRIDTGETQAGLSAQGAQAVVPQFVTEQKDGYLTLNYGAAAAVATVQLAREVVALRAMIEGLMKRAD